MVKRWQKTVALAAVCVWAGCASEAPPAPGMPTTDAGVPPQQEAGPSPVDGATTDASTPVGEDARVPDTGPLPDPVRILPLGDSLTFGTSASVGSAALEGGYRIHLHELLTEAGYAVDYVGTTRNGPPDFDGDCEATPGASIAAVTDLWTAAAPQLDPHVVLLMAGTNDALGVTADQPPAPAARALGKLIDRIASDAPGVRIVVAKLIPLVPGGFIVRPANAQRVPMFNNLLPEVVAQRREAGIHVELADLSSVDPDGLGDGIHPSTMETYDEMAELWFPAVKRAVESLREAEPR